MSEPEACPICLQADCEHSDEEKGAHRDAIARGEEVPFNASDEAQVAKVARTAKRSEKQAAQDLKWVMSDARGRRYVFASLARCGIYRSSFLAGRGQPEATAFYEGERNIGLELLARLLKETPAAYATMMQESGAPQ